MMKMVLIIATAGLIGCEMGSKTVSDDSYCRTTNRSMEACNADARCGWLVKPDGSEVCKAK